MPVPRIVVESNLWKDPDIRFAPSGVAVGDIPLVASTSHKEGDNWVTDHELWLQGKAFGPVAEAMAELTKGDTVIVTGRLVTEQWEDKEGGKQSRTRLLIDSFAKIPKRGERAARPERPASQRQAAPAEDPWGVQTDEPPF